MLNSAPFDTHKPHLYKKSLDPYIVLGPAKNDPFSKGHLTKKLFFCCFRYFYIKMNIFQGYFNSKSNFRKKSTHPTGTKVTGILRQSIYQLLTVPTSKQYKKDKIKRDFQIVFKHRKIIFNRGHHSDFRHFFFGFERVI
jgi:hypothetical protein